MGLPPSGRNPVGPEPRGGGGEVVEGQEPDEVARRALNAAQPRMPELLERLGAFSDPTRLELLIAVHAAPGAAVSTLAAATGQAPNTVSQALLRLREAGLVRSERDGRCSRWTIADDAAHALLHHLGAPHTPLHPGH